MDSYKINVLKWILLVCKEKLMKARIRVDIWKELCIFLAFVLEIISNKISNVSWNISENKTMGLIG